MLHHDVHRIAFKGHLQDYELVLYVIELLAGNFCTAVEVKYVKLLAELYVILCLERKFFWLEMKLYGKAVLVFLSHGYIRMHVVGDRPCLLAEDGIYLIEFSLFLRKSLLECLAFCNERLSCFRIKLAFHL